MPSTIRKNFHDIISEKFKNVIGNSNDSSLIMSALNGKFRTRTKQRYRGKGLPNIYKSYRDDKIIDKLKIISSMGYIDQGNERTIEYKFHGTLYTWEFV